MAETCNDPQRTLVGRLTDPAFHGPQCRHVRVIETHISYVVLTGAFAYKIKKAVDLGFLDFTTLAARRFFCQEEIRLNRRLAPSIYLDVVTITGTAWQPIFNGPGAAIEYAVRMREFPSHALMTAVIARGGVTAGQIAALGERIASFHGAARRALPHTRFGTTTDVLALATENVRDVATFAADPVMQRAVAALGAWTLRQHARLEPLLDRRRRDGFVRECHGDLHLGNVAMIDNLAVPFDCIEFNERMRWSDVMSDVAFLSMDLQAHGRGDLADRFLNRYLEESGDYEGLGVLRFFVVYRALVRAKVAMLRAAQTVGPSSRAAEQAAAARYLRAATRAARDVSPAVIITHGFSGSGKTTVASRVAAELRGIALRADVERKRLFGLNRLARTGATIAAGIYSPDATRRTYDRLAALTRSVVESGYVALVDASFLKRWQRDRFRSLARAAGLPFVVLDCAAPIRTLADRVAARAARADDASEAGREVLAHQIDTAEPLDAVEREFVLACDTTLLRPESLPGGTIDDLKRMLRSAISREPSAPGTSRAV